MTLSSIASKLRALRALAEAASATEGERVAAAEAYERLLHKYHLDASELDLQAEGATHITLNVGAQFDAAFRMAGSIGKFTRCKTWGQPSRYGTPSIHYIGLQSDVEFAEWLTRSLLAFIQREAMTFVLDMAAGTAFKGDAQAFALAASQRIGERLTALAQPDAPGTALVVVRSRLIDEEFDKLGIRLQAKGFAPIDGRGHAIAAGNRAGDRASFAKPATYARPLALPGGAK